MYACDGGNYKIVKLLLDKGADPNDAAKVVKRIPLLNPMIVSFSRVMDGLH